LLEVSAEEAQQSHCIVEGLGIQKKAAGVQESTKFRINGARRELDIIKLDCQGGEEGALRGGASLVESGRVAMLISEFSPVHLRALGVEPEEFLGLFSAEGRYEVSTMGMGTKVEKDGYVDFTREHEERAMTLVARRKTR
jgi:hypothetical protein